MNIVFAIATVVIKELYRRKDFYVLLVLTGVITGLLGTINIFNDSGIVRYLKEICLLLIWISTLVICITTAARQIPAERENRTIFPLLAKPVTRGQVIVGKFFGCWAACGIALVVFYLFFAVVAESKGHNLPVAHAQAQAEATGHDHADHDGHDHHEHDGHEHETHAASVAGGTVANYFQAFWLHWMALGIITAMVLAGSIIFAAPSSNSTICLVLVLGIMFVGGHLGKLALRMTEPLQTVVTAIYFMIPHLEWYADFRARVVNDLPPIHWPAIGGASLYAVVYVAIFLLLAWMAFRRKALSI